MLITEILLTAMEGCSILLKKLSRSGAALMQIFHSDDRGPNFAEEIVESGQLIRRDFLSNPLNNCRFKLGGFLFMNVGLGAYSGCCVDP